VALLRVLLSRPRALLLDEPFSKLDASLRAQFRNYVFAEVRSHQWPAIMVTHDPADAAATEGVVINVGS
jgi:putative thiamine transport system ATP-binding protein